MVKKVVRYRHSHIHLHTMDYYTAFSNNGILQSVTTLMVIEDVMLSEIDKTERMQCTVSLIYGIPPQKINKHNKTKSES